MARQIEFEGRLIEVPDDASDAEVAEIIQSTPAAPAPQAFQYPEGALGAAMQARDGTLPPATPVPRYAENGIVDAGIGLLGQFGRGTRRGVASLAGAPVDIVNAVMGRAGVPVSQTPVGGSASIDKALGGFGMIPEPPAPRGIGEQIAGRIGQEVGASMIPAAAVVGPAAAMSVNATRAAASVPRAPTVGGSLSQLYADARHSAALNPTGYLGREAAYATGAGTGAGVLNAAVGNPQQGDNFWSDFIGSLAGAGSVSLASGVGSGLRNIAAAVLEKPQYMSGVVGEAVTDKLINNSSMMAERKLAAQEGRLGTQAWDDTSNLAASLRRPAPVEEAVPGYRANIGDRTQDPQMMTYAQNVDMRAPGASNVRRTENNAAVSNTMDAMAPQGDPAQFRAAVQSGRDAEIAAAQQAAEQARLAAEQAGTAVQPIMRDATARGSELRSALQDTADKAKAGVSDLYKPINEATVTVDAAPLAERFAAVKEGLPLNNQPLVPREAATVAALAPEGGGPVPLNELTAVRSGLSDTLRAAQATPGGNQQARVAGMFKDETNKFIEQALPPELKAQYDAANTARRDYADRFERPGNAITDVLARKEGGDYRMDPSAAPGRFVQSDQGKVTDFRSLMKEAGTDPRARSAVSDEVLSQVQANKLLDKPEALKSWMDQRQIVLSEFPDLRSKLEAAGVSKQALAAAEQTAKTTERDLTTPGRTATASYLKYGDEATVDAMRSVTTSPDPVKATQELLSRAGNSPEALLNARGAFWKLVESQKLPAQGLAGEERWSGGKLSNLLRDPKTAAVAKELWRDNPEELANIQKVFNALGGAEGSTRSVPPRSSGTAQALSGKLDPALTMTSVASRARSVERGQMSPTIAVVDIVSTALRRRKKQVAASGIDNLEASVVNNPEMAADLLEKFNPADYVARRKLLQQKYGVRATQILNLADEEMDPQADVKRKVMER